MNRRRTSSVARWAGLVALGVALGVLLTSSLQQSALGGDPGVGDGTYKNYECKTTDCFDGGCDSGDPNCGICTGGQAGFSWYMCKEEIGQVCTASESKYGVADCNGACTVDKLMMCSCRWTKCQ